MPEAFESFLTRKIGLFQLNLPRANWDIPLKKGLSRQKPLYLFPELQSVTSKCPQAQARQNSKPPSHAFSGNESLKHRNLYLPNHDCR